MANWLQKIIQPPATGSKGSKLVGAKSANLPAQPGRQPVTPPQALPNATVIYGIGAALLFVASLSLLLHGRWFPAFIVFVLGACLTGFALHLLKHQD